MPNKTLSVPRTQILVVEDSERLRETFQDILESLGHVVRTAASGTEALRAYPYEACDVVMIDLGLPDITGYEVARELRTVASQSGVPVYLVAMTGYVSPGHKEAAAEAGFNYYLAKPFDLETLERVLLSRPQTPASTLQPL